MKFTKPPLSFEEQAQLLINRGLNADKSNLIKTLKEVNYYHLSGYLYPYKMGGSENFFPETSLKKIKEIMDFDNELKLIVFKSISILERWIRTNLVYNFTIHYKDPFAYTKYSSYPLQPHYKIDEFLDHLRNEMNNSREVFVQRYKTKYYQENYLPAWMAAEIMSMGTMNRFYQLMDRRLKLSTVNIFKVKEIVFHSWLNSIRDLRNICAHHSRLWNRDLSIIPKIPKNNSDWNQYYGRNNKKLFIIFSVIMYMLNQINCNTTLKDDLHNLFVEYRNIKLIKMDFPQNWKHYNFWI
ncbi:MAG: Abi family protein [Candidatus Cloacimonetes bacterium]|nr:Abi family protein [Candidatus Cloacimonadota bacterium]